MTATTKYFDVSKLSEVLRAKGWTLGAECMEFWARNCAKTAIPPEGKDKGKPTFGANIGHLPVKEISWEWLDKFPLVQEHYNNLIGYNNSWKENILHRNGTASKSIIRDSLINKYEKLRNKDTACRPFNPWLINGLTPNVYLDYHKDHQLQREPIFPFDSNGGAFGIFDELVAVLNNFSLYVIYKGAIINPTHIRKKLPQNDVDTYISQKVKSGLAPGSKMPEILNRYIVEVVKNEYQINTIIYISHIGIYAGDVYEFYGKQYLGTWDIINKTVDKGLWDAYFNHNNIEDPEDLSISNQTFNDYRTYTKKGQDFLIASPIRLVHYPRIITF